MWDKSSLDQLKNAVSTYDRNNVDRICAELIEHVSASDEAFPEPTGKAVLNLLRRKRFFASMRKVADAFLQSGLATGTVRRQYAQALIECGDFSAAIGVLEKLISECPDAPAEVAEARGLIGRALKQQYVNGSRATSVRARTLNRAVSAYAEVYRSRPTEYLWHGINAAALALRAQRDGVALTTELDPAAIARDILATISARTPDHVYAWDIATAAEACMVLGRREEALDWLRQYVVADGTDAFEVGSTLRQLKEVWCFHDAVEGGDLVAVLEAALLQREGGAVNLSGSDVESNVQRVHDQREAFERVFGSQGPVTLAWYQEGAARARGVGRVEDGAGRSIGSGFLIHGPDFFSWARADEVLFMTNAHVIGHTDPRALRPEQARVRFDGAEPKRLIAVKSLIWESPIGELDATVVRLESGPANTTPFPLAPPTEPDFVEGNERRFFVIGYPQGRELSISLHDNVQVGWRRPRLHYRTPTEPGSSGGPVFDENWCLVALHHAGSKSMQRLDGHPGFYEANEGLWIHQIIHSTREAPAVSEREPAAQVGSQTGGKEVTARRGVFISYCHRDRKFQGELEKFLKPFVRLEHLHKWDDNDIRPGEPWLSAIRNAMDGCRVAVMLVTQDYLASEFIQVEEFPKLLADAASGGVTVLWVAVSPSTYEATPIAALQAANNPDRPLTKLDKAEREAAWVSIVNKIRAAAK